MEIPPDPKAYDENITKSTMYNKKITTDTTNAKDFLNPSQSCRVTGRLTPHSKGASEAPIVQGVGGAPGKICIFSTWRFF